MPETLIVEKLVLAAHAVCAALGLGTVVSLDLLFLKYLAGGAALTDHCRRLIGHFVTMVEAGFLGLIATGIAILALRSMPEILALLAMPKFQAKLAIVGAMLANAMVLHAVALPRVLAVGRPVFRGRKTGELALLAVCGAVSSSGWMAVFLIGVQGAMLNAFRSTDIVAAWLGATACLAAGLFAAACRGNRSEGAEPAGLPAQRPGMAGPPHRVQR